MSEPSDLADTIKPEDIHSLLEHCNKTTHKVKDGDIQGEFIMERCLLLMARDYKYSVITNFNGELCGHYPSKLVMLEYQLTEAEKQSRKQEDVQSFYDVEKLRELVKHARYARCRSRFAVPVILYEGKHVCRSATLSGGAEMYGRQGLDFLFSGPPGSEASPNMSAPGPGPTPSSGEMQMFDRYRGQDIKLLKEFSVGYICDLMVEKKKVKFGLNITSSEKVDKENRYADFCILSIPYPGCEFFKEWKDNSYLGETMTFDWSQNYVDAVLDIPDDPLLAQVGIDWRKYRSWDLIRLTQNYLKLLLHILIEGDTGVLVHCISGWDRTPMFISLLRISLWADGVAHASLNPTEILYLTLAYDWYLFGHSLPDRVNKGEEILFFCFNFMTYMSSEEFSVSNKRKPSRIDSECNMEGVLLETDPRRHSYRGSNTSISSVGSSGQDPALATFHINSDEDTFTPGMASPNVVMPAHHRQTPLRPGIDGAVHFHVTHPSASSSSPVAVPSSVRHLADTGRASSPACGSWQVISSTGSLRGYATSSDSPQSFGSLTDSSASSSRLSSCCEATEIQETTRWKKLDLVRKIFHNAYANKIVCKHSRDASSIGMLLDQFAEKVGIRGNRNTFV
ncbi:myotubularin-related protein 14-like [Mizuhopecten yessoensis]|uniref:myotubularin-related protein 14-like n=1 Tax=Mizuhopecten yessoensis TaxID=6573 RepID=UPI000B45C3A1|nr:myotubularin-related protein 14-like [Mizuhopecten yessoensis]